VISYSPTGEINWEGSYNSGGYDFAVDVAVDKTAEDVVVAGNTRDSSSVLIVDYQGYTPSGHVLVPEEVRTINNVPASPDPAINNGKYLGFGSVATGGNKFKIEAAFPAYLNQSDNSTLSVKIFIAAQMPDDYSRLAYFDSSNNLKYQPPESLSSWKSSVSGAVSDTIIFPEVDINSGLSNIPSGKHYWYTLVVPDTVPDDFHGVDWSTTPWEITVNILNVP